ncbi:MAG: hypothetical protein C0490_11870 [Marivirga sp.]|nr:hypothetical protein [Marivirga sp.]
MSRTKKIFAIAALIFIILLSYASFDISRRTTFPGSKSQLKERLKKAYIQSDSITADTLIKKNQ